MKQFSEHADGFLGFIPMKYASDEIDEGYPSEQHQGSHNEWVKGLVLCKHQLRIDFEIAK